jgi:hypothetical protein
METQSCPPPTTDVRLNLPQPTALAISTTPHSLPVHKAHITSTPGACHVAHALCTCSRYLMLTGALPPPAPTRLMCHSKVTLCHQMHETHATSTQGARCVGLVHALSPPRACLHLCCLPDVHHAPSLELPHAAKMHKTLCMCLRQFVPVAVSAANLNMPHAPSPPPCADKCMRPTQRAPRVLVVWASCTRHRYLMPAAVSATHLNYLMRHLQSHQSRPCCKMHETHITSPWGACCVGLMHVPSLLHACHYQPHPPPPSRPVPPSACATQYCVPIIVAAYALPNIQSTQLFTSTVNSKSRVK